MSKFKEYLNKVLEDTISTANVAAPGAGQVGTIRSIKRKKNGKFEYKYAGHPATMTMKNPDGSYASQKKIDGFNEVDDWDENGIFIGTDQNKKSVMSMIPIQKRPIPKINKGKK